MSDYFYLMNQQLILNNQALDLLREASEELEKNGDETPESLRKVQEAQDLMSRANAMQPEINQTKRKQFLKVWGTIVLGFGLVAFVAVQIALDFVSF